MTTVKAGPVPLPESGSVVASSGFGLLPKGLLVILLLATLVSDTILNHHDILQSVGPGAVLVAVLAETVGRASPVNERTLTSPPLLQFKRLSFEALNFVSHWFPLESMRRVEDIRVPSRGNHSVHVRLYTPHDDSLRNEDGALPLIVWSHGGGWTLGSVRGDDRMARAFAKSSGAMVASIEYRLAPEHRWPAPLEDVVDAVAHLLDHGPLYNIDRHRVALAGESAGGHLSILTALSLASSHPGLLCGVVPIVPPVQYGCTFASCDEFATGRLLHKHHVEHFWNITVPSHLANHHSVSPLRAPRELLSRLPSTLILTAEQDPLQGEGEAFYERVRESGVAAEHVMYNKTIHLFFGRVATGGRESMQHVSAWFKHTCGAPHAGRARAARQRHLHRSESPSPMIL